MLEGPASEGGFFAWGKRRDDVGGLLFQRIAGQDFRAPFCPKGPHWTNTSDFFNYFSLFYFLFLPMLNSSVFFQQIYGKKKFVSNNFFF